MKPSIPWWALFLLEHYEAVLVVLVFPLVTALGNVALRKRTAEEWAEWAMKKPFLAFIIEFMRAAGLDPIGMVKAGYRYAARRAGKVPEGALKASGLPEGLKKALENPETRALLAEMVEAGKVKPKSEVPAPVAPDSPAG